MLLRSVELNLPDVGAAAAFLTETWGLAVAERRPGAVYLRGSDALPYLVGLFEAAERSVRSTTFIASPEEVARISTQARAAGAPVAAAHSQDPGGGEGVAIQAPDGEVFRFLANANTAPPMPDRDLPVKLTHVVFNATDAEATAAFLDRALGFKVSDRTKGLVFVRCNRSHHSVAFARAGYSSLNHIAFEMQDIDAVMRGVGRLRDHGLSPQWGPGRHGPGDNVFAYFVAPFGAVVEFSTAVNLVDEHHRAGRPEDWTWPPRRIDQWGLSDKDVAALTAAERLFRHAPLTSED